MNMTTGSEIDARSPDIETVRVLVTALKAIGILQVAVTVIASQNTQMKAALGEQILPMLAGSTKEMADQLGKLLDDANSRLANG
jgi:hypothetical protein